MAGADYHNCDACGRRVFYDARLDYSSGSKESDPTPMNSISLPDNTGSMKTLCNECAKTFQIIIVRRKSGRELRYKHTKVKNK